MMLFSQERKKIRQMFFDIWLKHQQQQPLAPLEQQVLQVMLAHTEYHFIFNNQLQYIDRDYFPELGETNPFLHLGLHITLLEQITMDRPAGIRSIFQQLLQIENGNIMQTEHKMLECLADSLLLAQQNNSLPDESQYLACLRKLLQ